MDRIRNPGSSPGMRWEWRGGVETCGEDLVAPGVGDEAGYHGLPHGVLVVPDGLPLHPRLAPHKELVVRILQAPVQNPADGEVFILKGQNRDISRTVPTRNCYAMTE